MTWVWVCVCVCVGGGGGGGRGGGEVQYLSLHQIGTKSIMLFRSNEILKNFGLKF